MACRQGSRPHPSCFISLSSVNVHDLHVLPATTRAPRLEPEQCSPNSHRAVLSFVRFRFPLTFFSLRLCASRDAIELPEASAETPPPSCSTELPLKVLRCAFRAAPNPATVCIFRDQPRTRRLNGFGTETANQRTDPPHLRRSGRERSPLKKKRAPPNHPDPNRKCSTSSTPSSS